MASKLTFSEDFNDFKVWNGASGKWDTSRWYAPNGVIGYHGEKQWYVNPLYAPTASANPYSISDGILSISAKPATSALLPLISGQTYTSGMITTYHSFTQTYGYFEMRAKLPAGQGMWPAFWLLPKSGLWPPELDVMEVLGDKPGLLYTTVHTATSGTVVVNPKHFQTGAYTTVADTSAAFHTYSVDWKPNFITWYFDKRQVFQTPTPSDMNKPMYILANLAVGGSWPGAPDASTKFPATMQIDYIRAYDSTPIDPAPTKPDSAGKLVLHMSEDRYLGDAQFTVSVDGVKWSGVQTVTAQRGLGQSQAFTFYKPLAVGPHSVSVSFLNDAYGGTGRDRNLYIESAELNGVVSSTPVKLEVNGTRSVALVAAASATAGPDTLVLQMSADAYQGDAAFVVSVDKVQLGGIHTVTARHGGPSQAFALQGTFAAGTHDVAVTFLNDAYDGQGRDRNLYVESLQVNDAEPQAGAMFERNGTTSFSVTVPAVNIRSRQAAAHFAAGENTPVAPHRNAPLTGPMQFEGDAGDVSVSAESTAEYTLAGALQQLGVTPQNMLASFTASGTGALEHGRPSSVDAAAFDDVGYAAYAPAWGGDTAAGQIPLAFP